MPHSISPQLMFEGTAKEAMDCYVSLFPSSEITEIEQYGPDEPGPQGSVKRATFVLAGQTFFCIDSPIEHDFTFTPSFSIFVDCESEAELRKAYQRLAAGGAELMPLDDYGFSALFGWVNDRFGVSWQLNLA